MATPGLTAIRDLGEARRMLLEDSLRGLPVAREFGGPIVDVGSGGGAPGIPLAAALPDRDMTLLDSRTNKVRFLETWAHEFPNLHVVHGRAEEQETDRFGLAVAKALAAPPVALEWCLPLVASGGAVLLWVGPEIDPSRLELAAELLGGTRPELRDGLLLVRKIRPTPGRFPRRPGMAQKRPLA